MKNIKTKWTKELVLSSAKKYKTKSEWRKDYPSARVAARRYNCYAEATAHMKNIRTKWTKELILSTAKKYNSKIEWLKKDRAGYHAAIKSPYYEKATAHMQSPLKELKWTKEKILLDAKKYKTKSEWEKKSAGAVSAARRLNCHEVATKHMVVVYNLNGKIFKSMSDIAKHYNINHHTLRDRIANGMDLELAVKLPNQRVPNWTLKQLELSAKKYKTKSEWRQNNNGAYQAWRYRGYPKNIVKHMDLVGSRYERCVYFIKVKKTKLVYIGLTYNIKRRFKEHMNTKRFKNLINIYGREALYIKNLTGYLDAQEAALKEEYYVKYYLDKGFTILNKVKAGSLGGPHIKWTYKEALKNAKTFNSFIAWRNSSKSSYSSASQKGWIDKILKETGLERKVKPRGYWTKEKILLSASKYNSKVEWLKKDGAGYHAALNSPFYEIATEHMESPLKELKWTKEKILLDAKKYKTKSEWYKKSAGAVSAARRLNCHEKATAHMKNIRKKWTKELVLSNSKKYKTKSEWEKKSAGALSAAKRLNIYEEATTHMKTLWNPKWDKASVINEAKKYKTKSEWAKTSVGSYTAAIKKGWMEISSSHMEVKKKKWTLKELISDAKSFSTFKEWREKSNGYNYARSKNWTDKILKESGLKRILKPKGYWTKEKIILSASKYKTKSEWSKKDGAGYHAAIKSPYFELVTSHML